MKDYKVIRSKRKNITFVVTKEAKVLVRVPFSYPESEIADLVVKHQKWIDEKLALMKSKIIPPKTYEDGDSIVYLGKTYQINYTDDPRIVFSLKDKLYISNRFKSLVKENLVIWYMNQGNIVIRERVIKLAKDLGFSPANFKMTRANKRWGSCSGRGGLCFSWRLMMAPPEIIDSVIIHELVHLEVKDHSKRFYDRLMELLPDYKEKSLWLKENGRKLEL